MRLYNQRWYIKSERSLPAITNMSSEDRLVQKCPECGAEIANCAYCGQKLSNADDVYRHHKYCFAKLIDDLKESKCSDYLKDKILITNFTLQLFGVRSGN